MTKNPSATAAPRVTIITPLRNAAPMLPGAIESFQQHATDAVEWWLVDGASTDGTLDVLRRLKDPRVHWRSEPDGGLYEAMNKGVDWARGRWIHFLGADDRLLSGFRRALDRLCDPETLYYGDVILASSGRRYDGTFSLAKLARTNICQQAIFYPRTVFRHRRFEPRYRWQADWEFNMYCRGALRLRFEYLAETIALYNDGGASGQAEDETLYRDYGRLLWRYFPLPAVLPPWLLWLASRARRAVMRHRSIRPRPL